jgi:8-oxo-dGTP diphosphatase
MDASGKLIEVCAAVVRDGSRTLLCKRPEKSAHAGFWEFPGGKLAPGESEHECLRREIREELGCETIPLDLLFRIEHEYPGKKVSVAFYRALPCGSPASFAPQEGQELGWFDTGSLCEVDLLPADLPLAEFLVLAAPQGNNSKPQDVID